MGRRSLVVMIMIVLMVTASGFKSATFFPIGGFSTHTLEFRQDRRMTSSFPNPVFHDQFNSGLGFNASLWDLETYGEGSVGWVAGEYLNMSCERHSFRTLSSKMTFEVGQEVSIRMKMQEDEAAVFIGWTNQTPTTGWNYHFGRNSTYIQGALSTALLEVVPAEGLRQRVMLSDVDTPSWHTYRIVWNDTAAIAYVDGRRAGVIGEETPTGPLHFKIAITEFRNMTTEGWILIDSVSISPHSSMVGENPPIIALKSPGNGTLNLAREPVEVVVVGSNQTLFYSWNGAQNQTTGPPFVLTLPQGVGLHTLDLYCQDGYVLGNWAKVQYAFEVVSQPPRVFAPFLTSTPTVDGAISQNEWPEASRTTLRMIRPDGFTQDVDVFLGHDESFFYVAIDSPLASGHDSKAEIILNGIVDGKYHGAATSPIMTAFYCKGSPDAWEGYSELHFLNETVDGQIGNHKIAEIPPGFVFGAVEVEGGVHYEFRVPVSELQASTGDTLGISVMIHPSGLGVHSLYYPMVLPLDNASKLALVELVSAVLPMELYLGIMLGVGALAAVSYVLIRRRELGDVTMVPDDSMRRLAELVRSYEEISIERLSRLAGLSETETEERIRNLMDEGVLEAEYDPSRRLVKRK
ncbi:MAG: hypothetical protein JSW05_11630 [Candidatus Thorarchaeota archaeon]|nr:MAG: hypothetical protein JSW05_11630 [Candidatus Thorarchaeota archaeon]